MLTSSASQNFVPANLKTLKKLLLIPKHQLSAKFLSPCHAGVYFCHMDEPFELPVLYKLKELMLPAQLIQQGYTHKFEILINDLVVYFEPDEEGSYRALIEPETLPGNIEPALLQAIADSIESILK